MRATRRTGAVQYLAGRNVSGRSECDRPITMASEQEPRHVAAALDYDAVNIAGTCQVQTFPCGARMPRRANRVSD
jgi:hypothetical protein